MEHTMSSRLKNVHSIYRRRKILKLFRAIGLGGIAFIGTDFSVVQAHHTSTAQPTNVHVISQKTSTQQLSAKKSITTPIFPLKASQWWHVDDFYMQADATLTQQGQLQATITTSSNSWGLGFTGGCNILLIDANENIIDAWLTWPLGVDAKGAFFNPHSRVDYPVTQIDAAIVAQVNRIQINLSRMEKNRWDDILKEFHKKIGDILDLV